MRLSKFSIDPDRSRRRISRVENKEGEHPRKEGIEDREVVRRQVEDREIRNIEDMTTKDRLEEMISMLQTEVDKGEEKNSPLSVSENEGESEKNRAMQWVQGYSPSLNQGVVRQSDTTSPELYARTMMGIDTAPSMPIMSRYGYDKNNRSEIDSKQVRSRARGAVNEPGKIRDLRGSTNRMNYGDEELTAEISSGRNADKVRYRKRSSREKHGKVGRERGDTKNVEEEDEGALKQADKEEEMMMRTVLKLESDRNDDLTGIEDSIKEWITKTEKEEVMVEKCAQDLDVAQVSLEDILGGELEISGDLDNLAEELQEVGRITCTNYDVDFMYGDQYKRKIGKIAVRANVYVSDNDKMLDGSERLISEMIDSLIELNAEDSELENNVEIAREASRDNEEVNEEEGTSRTNGKENDENRKEVKDEGKGVDEKRTEMIDIKKRYRKWSRRRTQPGEEVYRTVKKQLGSAWGSSSSSSSTPPSSSSSSSESITSIESNYNNRDKGEEEEKDSIPVGKTDQDWEDTDWVVRLGAQGTIRRAESAHESLDGIINSIREDEEERVERNRKKGNTGENKGERVVRSLDDGLKGVKKKKKKRR